MLTDQYSTTSQRFPTGGICRFLTINTSGKTLTSRDIFHTVFPGSVSIQPVSRISLNVVYNISRVILYIFRFMLHTSSLVLLDSKQSLDQSVYKFTYLSVNYNEHKSLSQWCDVITGVKTFLHITQKGTNLRKSVEFWRNFTNQFEYAETEGPRTILMGNGFRLNFLKFCRLIVLNM
uniref:Uncharacterized protein n=2 Tax=Cacopsylla melanoneura TaxID=428564 RepID=A0A8D8YS34_9HEMI